MSARGVIADNAVWCSAHDDAGRYRDADMLLSALSGAGLVVEQDWQPIVTAPKNGTRALFYAPAAEDRAAVWRVDYWWVQERGFARMRPLQPYTHWRPLPTPPAAEPDHD